MTLVSLDYLGFGLRYRPLAARAVRVCDRVDGVISSSSDVRAAESES